VKVYFTDHWKAYAELIPSFVGSNKSTDTWVSWIILGSGSGLRVFAERQCCFLFIANGQFNPAVYAKFWVNDTFNTTTLFS